jgi:hypothetical protein
MNTTVYDHEFELNGITYLVDLDLFGEVTDESFSHEFGIEKAWGFELTGLEVVQVQSEEGIITSPTIIKQIENRLDLDDFKHIDFD